MTAYSIDSLNKYGFYILTERGARLAISTKFEYDNCVKISNEKDSIILLYSFKVMNLEEQKRLLTAENNIYKTSIKQQKRRLFWQSLEKWTWRGLAGIATITTIIISIK